ncbi:SMI1/KNR4 family protein [Mucilaginibacter sp. OK098]|uniref:SMI1/KNR4 family protein n=1 Tax=Mucilaginibacter sp. OK098 TaxID=1855297 RepID=UPI00091A813D|nr:SMI1/KNR4 family protein [Mucilaginibacter sp. OK098]SHN37623.1 hypothetical protein SAMN05216524_11627 [Mucilaginibacter sp. OK098]
MAKVELIRKLLNYWKRNNVSFEYVNPVEVNYMLNRTDITLPKDFQELYKNVNGTADCDHEGFLFYRQEDIITMGKKFSLDKNDEFYNVAIFIDYMQGSWWYGVNIEGNSYEIGIIPHKRRFKPIANSLETFIDLYIEDSEILYDYD